MMISRITESRRGRTHDNYAGFSLASSGHATDSHVGGNHLLSNDDRNQRHGAQRRFLPSRAAGRSWKCASTPSPTSENRRKACRRKEMVRSPQVGRSNRAQLQAKSI